jgi:hypothetical protein
VDELAYLFIHIEMKALLALFTNLMSCNFFISQYKLGIILSVPMISYLVL